MHPPESPPQIPHDLAPEIRAVLDAELLAGNSISEVRGDSPVPGSLIIILSHPFRTPRHAATANLRYRQVNLPGWWGAEYTAAAPPHTLACP